jgi:tol-pal system protein YbgF
MVRRPVWAPIALGIALAWVVPASAAIFSDDEARKAILDLRNRLAQSDARSEEQLRQIEALRKSLLELNTQLDLLRSDLARSRGAQEQLARDLSEVQREQRNLGTAVDERVRKLEPLRVTVDGREFLADPQEKRQYEEAVARMRTGDFESAASALAAFVRRYPGSGYFESANFWLGNALYGKRDYREAMAAFRLTARAAEHPRTPEALLAIANCLIEMKDAKAARVALTDLVKAYPDSEAAKAAKERLTTLR